MKEFKDQVAVVTGAASGIGRGMAENFISAGMKVVLADIEEDRLMKTVKSFRDSGADVTGVPMDVSKIEEVRMLKDKALDAYGAVHVLCNNAGVGYGGGASWELPVEAWTWVFGANLMGVIYCINTFVPLMLEQGTDGHVVNTASIAGLVTNSFSIPYGVSKHAVVALSESMHMEFKNKGSKLRASVLCPGPINTDIIDSSERNRPDWVPPPPEPYEEMALFIRAYEIWLERGMDPAEVGRMVMDAIREERFYVITHDFNKNIELKMKNVLEHINPEPSLPPQELMEIYQEVVSKSKEG